MRRGVHYLEEPSSIPVFGTLKSLTLTLTPSLLLAFVVIAGCADATAVLDEPDIARMELVVDGSVAVTIQSTGNVTGPGVRVSRSGPTQIEAVFRDDDGAIVATEGDFEAAFVPGNSAALQFTRTGPRRGTLAGLILGSTPLTVKLRHISQGHDDFSATTVTVLVQ